MKPENALSCLKVPYLFQDLMCLMFGFILLFILNFVIKFNIKEIPNYSEIGDVVKSLVFFSVSYFSGRMGLVIGNSLVRFFEKVLYWMTIPKEQFYPQVKMSFQNLKLYIKKERIQVRPENNLGHEIECFIQNNKHLRLYSERNRYHIVFLRLLLGCSAIVFVFSPSWTFFCLILVILIYSICDAYENTKERIRIGGIILAEKKDHLKNNNKSKLEK